ncbi:hypothetical protein [Streptomyces sp. BBFR102]|uniref:hypothetical protein n=1 Tax=Streptomyces sp. BBFR102 TaxID=3448171 RepID=UPI003F52CBD2
MGDRTTRTESGSASGGADGAAPRAGDAGPDPGDDGAWCTGGGVCRPAVPARPLPAAPRRRATPECRTSLRAAVAAGATALLVVLLLGGVAGRAGGVAGIALGLALFGALVAAARPWRYVLPHFLAGLWIIGFASVAFQDALLLTRGEWVSAVVTRDLRARTGPRCDLADLRGRPLPPTTSGCRTHHVGDRVRVLADPLLLVPSRFESPPVRDACLTWGAAGTVHVAAGAAAGYGVRRGERGAGRRPGGGRTGRANSPA